MAFRQLAHPDEALSLEDLWVRGAITQEQLFKLNERSLHEEVIKELDQAIQYGYHILDYQHPFYPPSLKRSIWSYPLIYLKSPPRSKDLSNLWDKIQIGMIGTRSPSLDANDKIQQLLDPFNSLSSQIQIISGLAMGVDRFSHEIAAKHEIGCIAVLGQGLNTYKQQSKWEDHVHLCSMFPPNQPGSKVTYPMRNQIIAGLSDGLVIIESKKRSGTMITYQQALEDGIPIWAHTGNWKSKNSEGPIQILRMGGTPIQNGLDLLDDFEVQFPQYSWTTNSKSPQIKLKPEEKLVFNYLEQEPLTVADLGYKLNIDSRDCFSILGTLEAKGVIRFNWDGKWSLKSPSLK